MKKVKQNLWIFLALLSIIVIVLATIISLKSAASRNLHKKTDAFSMLPERRPHVNHSDLIQGPFEDGPSVTRACLECHENAARDVMKTAHWTWESKPLEVPWRKDPIRLGKKNGFNNFCIGIGGNWPKCTSCHIGYGWKDQKFDFEAEENVDCLSCHDGSGSYAKGEAGQPAEGVDLLKVAKSVNYPSRVNCGSCHFRGGGGDAVKHGDLDESLYNPSTSLDIHMGKNNMECINCHRAPHHDVMGRSMSVHVDTTNQIGCTNCHVGDFHQDKRLNSHLEAVSCQACHIPQVAKKHATKTHWDWSKAGDSTRKDEKHHYLRIKGEFKYEKNLQPEYYWYNGFSKKYLKGDTINPDSVTNINEPLGNIADANAKIWPFKVHRGKQIYDKQHNWLIQPKTVGAYWKNFDWDEAARLGGEISGLGYSGEYGWARTLMYWPLSHMVSEKGEALQCMDCHGENGRMNWSALGYGRDPMRAHNSRSFE